MEQTNDFQAQELGVSADVAEMPETAVNEMPAVEQPKLVPEEDLRKLQSVLDKRIAEIASQAAAKDEQIRYLSETVGRFEQERINSLDPDERTEYEKNLYAKQAKQAQDELNLVRLQQKAISLGLDMETAMTARSVADLDRAMWQKEQNEKETLRQKLAEYESQKVLETRKSVDVVVPMGVASPRKLSANELIAKGVEELINPRR